MGSNSKQGWYLFMFIVGFTLAPAGLVALGWVVTAAGSALLVASLLGFRSIKEDASGGRAGVEAKRVSAPLEARAAKSF